MRLLQQDKVAKQLRILKSSFFDKFFFESAKESEKNAKKGLTSPQKSVPYFFYLPRTSGDYINDIGDIGHNPDPLRSDRRNR